MLTDHPAPKHHEHRLKLYAKHKFTAPRHHLHDILHRGDRASYPFRQLKTVSKHAIQELCYFIPHLISQMVPAGEANTPAITADDFSVLPYQTSAPRSRTLTLPPRHATNAQMHSCFEAPEACENSMLRDKYSGCSLELDCHQKSSMLECPSPASAPTSGASDLRLSARSKPCR